VKRKNITIRTSVALSGQTSEMVDYKFTTYNVIVRCRWSSGRVSHS